MQHIINDATARYPRLNRTYKFDSGEMKSVPCDPMDDGAAYEMQFIMTEDEAKKLHALCLQAWEEAKAKDTKKKWPDAPANLPYKRTDDGIIGKAKLKGAYGTEKTQPPRQVDAKRNPMPDDFMLTTGSKVNVAVTLVAYNTGSVNGVSLRLRAVQVINLAEMQVSDPFAATDGYVVGGTAGNDPFAAASPAPASSDLDDDIPF
jgi:hypothetical protein